MKQWMCGLLAAMVLVLAGCHVESLIDSTDAARLSDAAVAREGAVGDAIPDTAVTPVPVREASVETDAIPTEASVPGACAEGQTTCGGACVNTQTDVAHCGACRRACNAGQTCVAGACSGAADASADVVTDAADGSDVAPVTDVIIPTDAVCARVRITCGVGACQRQVEGCEGTVTCVPGPSSPEVCGNAVDENCDGVATMCPVMPACIPAAEVCNGRDDDCDGQTDEGNVTCGVGRCIRTVSMCVSGGPNICVAGTPVAEICSNGQDDDCDGSIDEGCPAPCVPTGAEVCGNAVDENCDGIVATCPATTPTCTPVAETCNGRDDDCDGMTDELLGTTECGVGACRRVVDRCVAGALNVCTTGTPVAEVCGNGIDDDCDGSIDEGCSGGTPVGVARELRIASDVAWFNVPGNCTNCGVCASGWITSVFGPGGERRDSVAGQPFREVLPESWRGVAAVAVRCGSDLGSARWVTWPASLQGRPVSEAGIASMTWEGEELRSDAGRVCTWGGFNRPLAPLDATFRGRCP